ncbi:hypothetical protein [Candidatus Manganitrophus noduliformans]|uniref:Uncharacterized protein n=1 Tax=Candidatus Manganitrophus noduliformans TaxID=2606439 RepID=A0A7X6IB89_9BACT|nr:hypothetical protein [Candidatus Manganitrophus noduliformans]NKE71154.1 hypothetical protein [Candidatus Manganitrophus noduliformans]
MPHSIGIYISFSSSIPLPPSMPLRLYASREYFIAFLNLPAIALTPLPMFLPFSSTLEKIFCEAEMAFYTPSLIISHQTE